MSEFPYACAVFGCIQTTVEGSYFCRFHKVHAGADDLQRGEVSESPEVSLVDLLKKRDDSKLAETEAKLEAAEEKIARLTAVLEDMAKYPPYKGVGFYMQLAKEALAGEEQLAAEEDEP